MFIIELTVELGLLRHLGVI